MFSVRRVCFLMLVVLIGLLPLYAGDGNRLTYLDENNPYYPHRDFPKLITPQWVGEKGVEAVVILAIDDMRDPQKYEDYLRPILIRLKQIDGRAPVSIMTCSVNPQDEQLQQWLTEGLSIEVHTIDHPCPLLSGGDFKKAKSTYDRCVDLLNQIPGNGHRPQGGPVAFRMPCCDSLNAVSPRFYAEIFNKTTKNGNYLQASSSVFNIFTSDDPEIPRDLVIDADGRDRFLKYIPKNLNRGNAVFNTFVNTIENYPYPYVINKLCWEFPCVVPSDWEAQHLHGKNNPKTVADMKAVLDITVLKQGVFNLVFHPHGWIRNDQIVDLINHAVKKHGKKVKFLTFREAVERLNENLLAENSLRDENRKDRGVRILDVNNDGYLDVVIGTSGFGMTRLWKPRTAKWQKLRSSVTIVDSAPGFHDPFSTSFGIHGADHQTAIVITSALVGRTRNRDEDPWGSIVMFDKSEWSYQKARSNLNLKGNPSGLIGKFPDDVRARFIDIDDDGSSELLVFSASKKDQWILRHDAAPNRWTKLPFTLPAGTWFTNRVGKDAGLRFVDLNEDGHDDIVFSNHERYGIWLFKDMQTGWSIEVLSGKRDKQSPRAASRGIPPIVRKDGSDNGFFVHNRTLFWQNEDTANLPDLVDRRSFNDLLKNVQPGPKSPKASLKAIRTRPGFRVELVAAEPLVMDPVAFAWGADGKLWVVEMADYPSGIDGKGKPGGRIRYLEDTDGDGKYDKSTLFLDGVRFPNGILPWKKGVLVTAAPDIFYAEDTNGDGKADKREVLFTGFAEGNQQHRVNGLVYGLDNWVYCANGDSGGVVRPTLRNPVSSRNRVSEDNAINIGSMDVRINPDTGEIDLQAGRTQFGRNRDGWGNWFGSNNSNPMWHYVLADHYNRRNKHIAAPDARVHFSNTPGAVPCFPISRTLARFNDFDRANRFTSACSAIVYGDELFGRPFIGNTFVSEPVHNLVHREVKQPRGFSFTSRRAADEQTSEFLSSSDNWFRPTMIKTGPDGALWIADMYRHVIEHPKWIPADWQKRLDLRAGHDRGRIYCVVPVGKSPRKIPQLDKLSTQQLVAALNSPSGWQRDTAQRLLIERNDPAAVPLLAAAVRRKAEKGRGGEGETRRGGKTRSQALCRLHALCTLDGLGSLTPEVLLYSLNDPHPGVRRHAVRLCETLKKPTPKLIAALLKLTRDTDPQVRLQLACTLGEIADLRTGAALGQLLLADGADRYFRAAVMSSLDERNIEQVVLAVLANRDDKATAKYVKDLMAIAAALGRQATLIGLLHNATTPVDGRFQPWQFAAVSGLLNALDRRKTSLAELSKDKTPQTRQAFSQLAKLLAASRKIAADARADSKARTAAVPLLGRGLDHRDSDVRLLASLLAPQNPVSVQRASAETLGRLDDDGVAEIFVQRWRTFGLELRSDVLGVLMTRPAWQKQLLDALERKQILPRELGAAGRQKLLTNRSPQIRKRAQQLFAVDLNADRRKLVAEYRGALTRGGDRLRGAKLFEKHCAQCHKLAGVGVVVGPDLKSLTDKSPQALLIAVLDPNRAVESKYISYTAVTTSGLTFTGLLAAETGNSITLKEAKGKEHVILRTDLEELVSSSKSTMPEGLEKELKPQDLADLIAHVRSNVPLPTRKQFPGNQPKLVKATGDGSLTLTPATCEIYGSTLVLEKKYGNLGYWASPDDYVVWDVEVRTAGRYRVEFNYACHNGTAGNKWLLSSVDDSLEGTVTGTGDWDTYRSVRVGQIRLANGRQQITMRATGAIRGGALIDLKRLRLIPAE